MELMGMPLLGQPCPGCGVGNDSILELVDIKSEIEVQGEIITVDAKVFRCSKGIHEYYGEGATDDIADAQRVYREIHNYAKL